MYEDGKKKAKILQVVRKGSLSALGNYSQSVCFLNSIFLCLQNISANMQCEWTAKAAWPWPKVFAFRIKYLHVKGLIYMSQLVFRTEKKN